MYTLSDLDPPSSKFGLNHPQTAAIRKRVPFRTARTSAAEPTWHVDAPIDLLGFASGDPFANAGLFQSVEIRRWRKVIFNPPQD